MIPDVRALVVAQHGEAVARRMDREAAADAKFWCELKALPKERMIAAVQAVPAAALAKPNTWRRLVREQVRLVTRNAPPLPPRVVRAAPRRREHRAGRSSCGPSGDEPEPPPAERLLKVAEVAARFSVSRKTVHYWLAENLLPARRLPSQGDRPLVRIPAAAVDRFAAGFTLHARRPRPHRVPRGAA